MPATDSCQPQVIRAIEKAGYRLTHKSFSFRPGEDENFVYADLRFVGGEDPNQVIIVVEVKCFPVGSAITDEFYQAVGQYLLYRNGLALAGIKAELYLAIPLSVHEDFVMERQSVQVTLSDSRIQMIVVDLAVEEVTLWKIW